MHLVRDVLDKELVSERDHDPMGRADGVILELRDGQPPRVVAIECGFPVLARRLHPRLERIVKWIGRRWGVRRGRSYRIPWSRVKSTGTEIVLTLDAERSPATAWERWLRDHFTRHIPGSGK
jgi:hypothetical protein